jgi:cysteine synthase A
MPLVELRRIVRRRGLEGRILAKPEYLNPGLSKKDRVACETGSAQGEDSEDDVLRE